MSVNRPTVVKAKNGGNARQKMLQTFRIDFKSDMDDRQYLGNFTTKKMSISDLAALGVRKTQLNGGYHFSYDQPGYGVDEQTDNFNGMIAHLEISLVESPDWWNLAEITDGDLLAAVFKEVAQFENSFLERRRAAIAARENSGHDGDEQESSSRDLEGREAGGVASTLVGEEVQAALEP